MGYYHVTLAIHSADILHESLCLMLCWLLLRLRDTHKLLLWALIFIVFKCSLLVFVPRFVSSGLVTAFKVLCKESTDAVDRPAK